MQARQVSTWTSVESTRISAVKYDEVTRQLDVRFRNGRVYSYSGVSRVTFDALVNSESIGSAFTRLIERSKTIKGSEVISYDSTQHIS